MQHRNPFKQFEAWFQDARKAGEPLPESMALATSGPRGKPAVRIMLLKDVSKGGFVFFTNYTSRKGGELEANPVAAMAFHWPRLERQVRIEGKIQRTSRKESESYYKTRPRGSQLGAWASPQSKVIPDREFLEERLAKAEQTFFEGSIPCPEYWGGFRLVPERIEFWQGRPHRLHDRIVFVKKAGRWRVERLAP